MKVILTPGQGSQKPGILQPFLNQPDAEAFLHELSDASSVDLVTLGTTADEQTITETQNAQPLIVAATLLAQRLLPSHSVAGKDTIVIGHSIGELSAACVAGIISPHTAIYLAAQRGSLMANACHAQPTTMIALLGGDRDEVLDAIDSHGLFPANFNAPGQIIAAGESDRCAALEQELPAGVRIRPLAVAGAFHTPYMQSAQEAFSEIIAALPASDISDPQCVLLSNNNGQSVTSGRAYLDLIVQQLTSPVRFDACCAQLHEYPIDAMMELAPAGVLSGIVKRQFKNATHWKCNTPEEISSYSAQCDSALQTR